MSRHLIVSCGTSQIEKEGLLGRLSLQQKTLDYCRGLENDHKPINEETPDVLDKRIEYKDLIGNLVNKWNDLLRLIGTRNNPFGAEVSTLAKMKEENKFDPTSDSVVGLYSDTMGGAFCAAILRGLLIHSSTWNMTPGCVTLKRVPELREDPDKPEKAEENLCAYIVESLEEEKSVLVVTGGFKSGIPFFTTVALEYNVPMFYLFERSKNLRRLIPPAEVQQVKDQNFWQRISGTLSSGPPTGGGQRIIFTHRAKNYKVHFGSRSV